jgi:hypothetical protein
MSCIFLNQFILHGSELDNKYQVRLSHTNIFEYEWGPIVGFLRLLDENGNDIPPEQVIYEIDASSKFQFMATNHPYYSSNQADIDQRGGVGKVLKLKDNQRLEVADADHFVDLGGEGPSS